MALIDYFFLISIRQCEKNTPTIIQNLEKVDGNRETIGRYLWTIIVLKKISTNLNKSQTFFDQLVKAAPLNTSDYFNTSTMVYTFQ